MKPESYLTKEGKQLFNRLAEVLKEREQDNDEFNLHLSMLCHEYIKYKDAQLKSDGWVNVFKNNTTQVNAYVTLSEKSLNSVLRLSSKFGLTPKDLEGVKEKEATKKPKGKLGQMIKVS